MTRRFNGTYSVRAGYHGVKKSGGVSINSDFWTCENGHINPKFELVDERASGGFVHREPATVCKRCTDAQPIPAAPSGTAGREKG